MAAGMDSLDTTVYFVSALLQLGAMVFALLMAKQVNDRRPWLLLLAALLVMFGARILAITVPPAVRNHITPFIACVISSLLWIALFAIRRVAIAEQQSKAAAEQSAVERDESEGRYRSL